MIIHLNKTIKEADLKLLQDTLKDKGFKSVLSEGQKVVVGVLGTKEESDLDFLETLPLDYKLEKLNSSYKLVSRDFHPENSIINVDGLLIGGDEYVTMAGPCSVEGREQIFETARMAAAGGAKVLRGGAFKPRTSPYDFQGLGEEGLQLMREAADRYDLKMITEVMDEGNLDLVCQYTDIIQIGARNMQNFRLLEAVGRTGKPVALKRGISGTINEWLHAAEYIAAQGNLNIIFIERGIRTYEQMTRNTFDLSAVPIIQGLSHLPIIVDPSHGVGVRECIKPMALAGLAAGASGMIVEIHPDPNKAWSDGPQSLNEADYLEMMKEVAILEPTMKKIKKLRQSK
ncbi:3-deoxy-7-phosphoheptulonate synthase [Vagococcus coleopterorum]|uniref:3-deoxy-7-phosphoheptulonate synthase n=1 Tax=Vagococcus coleopterorum TaxID=2714946 RepID=A0A6G8ANH9_9ENTE|nr:3-deoxy-7-phosphoheptulonate synthase [Vagococcus coleopterorum]QIL46556.1 3-deoxy-7-phosphoheptulonate synthase [Vagococcus coleopterorum]